MIPLRRAFVVAVFVLSLPAAGRAQIARPVEVFGGYTFAHDALNNVSLPAGWLAGGAVGVNDWLSAVVDVSGGYKTIDLAGADIRLTAHAAMAGARASARVGRLIEFGELLAGVVRGSGAAFGFTNTTNAFALQPGVGVDLPLGARVAARAQLDVRLIRSQPGGNEAGYEYRFSAALVYRIR
jgi:hypothetical protein